MLKKMKIPFWWINANQWRWWREELPLYCRTDTKHFKHFPVNSDILKFIVTASLPNYLNSWIANYYIKTFRIRPIWNLLFFSLSFLFLLDYSKCVELLLYCVTRLILFSSSFLNDLAAWFAVIVCVNFSFTFIIKRKVES